MISLGIVSSSQSKGGKTGPISTFTWVDDGNGASTSRTFTVSFTGGSGTGATFTIARTTKISTLYYVASVTLATAGTGYRVGDLLTYTDSQANPVNNIYVTVTAVV